MKKFRIVADIEFNDHTDPKKVKGTVEQYLLHGKDRSFGLKSITAEPLDTDVTPDLNQLDLFGHGKR